MDCGVFSVVWDWFGGAGVGIAIRAMVVGRLFLPHMWERSARATLMHGYSCGYDLEWHCDI